MAGSGTSRLAQSIVEGRKGSESAMTSALSDANNFVLKNDYKGKSDKKKEPKKGKK